MSMITQGRELLLGIAMVMLAGALLPTLVRAMLGPRFTDRIVAINMISTQTIMIICILAFLLGEQYLVDIGLVYSMISFMAVVALANLYLSRIRARAIREAKELELLESEHEIELQGSTSKEEAKV